MSARRHGEIDTRGAIPLFDAYQDRVILQAVLVLVAFDLFMMEAPPARRKIPEYEFTGIVRPRHFCLGTFPGVHHDIGQSVSRRRVEYAPARGIRGAGRAGPFFLLRRLWGRGRLRLGQDKGRGLEVCGGVDRIPANWVLRGPPCQG